MYPKDEARLGAALLRGEVTVIDADGVATRLRTGRVVVDAPAQGGAASPAVGRITSAEIDSNEEANTL